MLPRWHHHSAPPRYRAFATNLSNIQYFHAASKHVHARHLITLTKLFVVRYGVIFNKAVQSTLGTWSTADRTRSMSSCNDAGSDADLPTTSGVGGNAAASTASQASLWRAQACLVRDGSEDLRP